MKKFKSNKAYNKHRKQFLLGKDVLGNKLYPGDFVEILLKMECEASYCSIIYWSPLNGAIVDSHPTHKWMDKQSIDYFSGRALSSILRNQSEYNNPDLIKWRPTVTKINEEKYLKYNEEIKEIYKKEEPNEETTPD
jgi:hypothetical protein